VLTVDPEGLRVKRYWDPLPDPQPVTDRGRVPHEVRERFEAAVERQLVSDVEVASYLSGGLDTGAVTAAASGPIDRLTTFCAGFDTRGATGLEAGFDERADARGLAEWLGTHHHELVLDAHDMEMVLPRLVRHLEEPRMSFSYPNFLTAGIASRWVKVVLSGVGGDELFGGYPWRYALADHPEFPGNYFGYWERLLAADGLRRALTAPVLREVELERPRAVFGAIMEPAADLPALDRILYTEARTFLHGLLLVEDKVSMAHSLESRVPFLDNDLVDYVLTLPAEVKLEGSLSKDLFRRAMRGRLPDEVLSRKKTGFTPPQAAWFQGSQAGYVRDVLLSERARDRGVLRVEFVEQVLEDNAAGRRDHRLLLWTLLCLEWWHRIFLDGEHAT
jgi:asparagine synthase (glutamine-hydrolysing)